MADVASLAVGLHLNAANFKSQLMGAYGDAENSSKRFNRNAQEDAKRTDEAYSRMGKTIALVAWRDLPVPVYHLAPSLLPRVNTDRLYPTFRLSPALQAPS